MKKIAQYVLNLFLYIIKLEDLIVDTIFIKNVLINGWQKIQNVPIVNKKSILKQNDQIKL